MQTDLQRRAFLVGMVASSAVSSIAGAAGATENVSYLFHEAQLVRHLGGLRFLARFVSDDGRALSSADFGLLPARCLLPEAWPRYSNLPPLPWQEKANTDLISRLEGQYVRLSSREWQEVSPDRFGHRVLTLEEANTDIELNRTLIKEGLVVASARDAAWRNAHTGHLRNNETRLLLEDARVFALDYAAEDAAHSAKRGLWSAGWKHLSAQSASQYTKYYRGFVIVRGTPLSHQETNTLNWLNFGHNPKRDFTLAIPRALRSRLIQLHKIEISELPGHTLEMRGWLEWRGGPYINLSAPHRLRILD
ncbi:MAG: hypothetical protein OD811_05750 [Alphaproteobacteria bacterium]